MFRNISLSVTLFFSEPPNQIMIIIILKKIMTMSELKIKNDGEIHAVMIMTKIKIIIIMTIIAMMIFKRNIQ